MVVELSAWVWIIWALLTAVGGAASGLVAYAARGAIDDVREELRAKRGSRRRNWEAQYTTLNRFLGEVQRKWVILGGERSTHDFTRLELFEVIEEWITANRSIFPGEIQDQITIIGDVAQAIYYGDVKREAFYAALERGKVAWQRVAEYHAQLRRKLYG